MSTFLDVLSRERILKQYQKSFGISANKLSSILTSPLEWFYSNSVSKVVLNAKSSCFNVRVIKNKNKTNQNINSIRVVEDGAKQEGVVL